MNWPVPFQSTVWAEIDRAKERDPEAYLRFVERYRPAILGFLRSWGFSGEDAEDLAQETFLSLVQGDTLARVRPARGKFRSLILAVVKNVVSNELRRRGRIKRGGGRAVVSLEQVESGEDPAVEEAFDRIWAKQLLSAALQELSMENPGYYRALSLSLEGRDQKSIAKETGGTVAQVNNHLHRSKAWLVRTIRRLIAEYSAGDDDYAAELRHLSKYLTHDRPV